MTLTLEGLTGTLQTFSPSHVNDIANAGLLQGFKQDNMSSINQYVSWFGSADFVSKFDKAIPFAQSRFVELDHVFCI